MREVVIKVCGLGGAGCYTLNELKGVNADMIAVHTDANILLNTNAHTKILIGKDITGGRSVSGDISLGEKCARYDIGKLLEVIGEPHLFFIICGLGGGTGSGASPVIAELAKSRGALTIAIVALPFKAEGIIAKQNAELGLNRLRDNTDAVVLMFNDYLIKLKPDLPIQEAFNFLDRTMANMVKELVDLIGENGLVNLGVADLRSILHNGKTAMVAIGEAKNAQESIENALNSILGDMNLKEVKGVLVSVTGGENLQLDDAETITKIASSKMPNASVIWGAQINSEMNEKDIKTLLIMSK